jgi:hypothetical protein
VSTAVAESPTPVNPAFEQEFRTLMRSGQQLIAINGCAEMYRARVCIQQIATNMPREPWTLFTWNPGRGFTWSVMEPDRSMKPIPFLDKSNEAAVLDPAVALRLIPAIPLETPGCRRAIFVFQNLHLHLENLVLRDILQTLVDEGKFTSNIEGRAYKRLVVLLHPAPTLHRELRNYAVPVTFPPANEHDLAVAIDYVGNSIMGGGKGCPPELRDRLAASMLGLTKQQGEDVTAKCLAALRGWSEDMFVLVEEAKAAQIGQEGYLTYVPRKAAPELGNIGGWDLAEKYVRRQCLAYTPKGRAMKLKVPRGILALGLPGTGKSLFAKMVTRIIYDATGQVFPTYRLNYDALFGGIVGETEANVRRLLEILYAQKRYILVVDEMEKFLGTSGTENDGGVSRKASAKFLDWLSERVLRTDDDTDYGYVIGTMNSLAGLEPEFLRRFNATFFVDLPDPQTRLNIFKIQLRLQHADADLLLRQDGQKLSPENWDELIGGTKDFSGSEIEQAVTLAREIAAESHGVDLKKLPLAEVNPELARPTFGQLVDSVTTTGKSIMARVHGERIDQIRKWCQDRALPVHLPQIAVPVGPGRRGGRAVDI